jgi:hypothetical protein
MNLKLDLINEMLPTLSLELHHFSSQFVRRAYDEHHNAFRKLAGLGKEGGRLAS